MCGAASDPNHFDNLVGFGRLVSQFGARQTYQLRIMTSGVIYLCCVQIEQRGGDDGNAEPGRSGPGQVWRAGALSSQNVAPQWGACPIHCKIEKLLAGWEGSLPRPGGHPKHHTTGHSFLAVTQE